RVLPTLSAVNESAESINMDMFAASPAGDWISFSVYGNIEGQEYFRKLMVYHIGSQAAATFRRREWTYVHPPYGQGATVADSVEDFGTWSRTGEQLLASYGWWADSFPLNVSWSELVNRKIQYLP